MRIVLALDKFKGTLTALQACQAVQQGLQRSLPNATFAIHPVADGGDGTVDALAACIKGQRPRVRVWNPLKSANVDADFLLAGETAYLEMAAASGLVLLTKGERDPLHATTYGTGQVIQAALDHGAQQVVVGLGGSATNDGGTGIAQALGFRFLDSSSIELHDLPSELAKLTTIEPPRELPNITWTALADVTNPLLGENGATAVYGPQKGVTASTHQQLEDGLAHLANVVKRDLNVDFRDAPGAGAAGGCAFGLMSFFGAVLRPGFEFLAEMSGLEAAIASADLVITGEGLLDSQTLSGKAPAGVAAMAKRLGTPVAAIGGDIVSSDRGTLRKVFQTLVALTDAVHIEEALTNAEVILQDQAELLGQSLRHQRY